MTNDELNIRCVLALGWTMHPRVGAGKCSSDIPKYEAMLWENHFVPPQYNGDTAHWTGVPRFATDLNAARELCDRIREEGYETRLENHDLRNEWECTFLRFGRPTYWATDKSLARAIAIAFIAAKGEGK